ncbi:MAG: hypothetical protein ACLGXA_05415 [Acidobacteriota bacterium]
MERSRPGRIFLLLLTPLAVVSLPSLLFCALAVALRFHVLPDAAVEFHLPAQTGWDHLLALELYAYAFVSRWNSAATLAATALFVTTLLLPRWRHYLTLAVIPYALLLCADFTLHWR